MVLLGVLRVEVAATVARAPRGGKETLLGRGRCKQRGAAPGPKLARSEVRERAGRREGVGWVGPG